jgi:predicted RNase H-like HicB family nuclease
MAWTELQSIRHWSIGFGKSDAVESAMRQTLIHRGEDDYWIAECPSLPGCISQGQTREEAIENIREAIVLYIEALKEDNLPVPPETFDAILVAV